MQPFRGLRHGLLIAAAAFRSRGCGRRSSSSYSSPFVLCWSLLRTTWFTKGISSMQQSLGPNTVLLLWTLNKKWTEHIASVLHNWGTHFTTPWKDGFWHRAVFCEKRLGWVWPLIVNPSLKNWCRKYARSVSWIIHILSDYIFCTTCLSNEKRFLKTEKKHHQHLNYQYILRKNDFPTLFYYPFGCQEMPLDAIGA